MDSLRIAHVLSSFGMGGQERLVLDLAAEQARRGHHVMAISLAPPPHGVLAERFIDQGIMIHSVPKGDGFDVKVVTRLARLLRQQDVDVVHTHNPQPLLYGALAARLARRVIIHTKHGANPERGRRLWLRRASGYLTHAYVAVSEATERVARANQECRSDRLTMIANGIDLGAFHPDDEAREEIRGELGIPRDAFVIGTVGRVSVEKNHVMLVRAAGPLLNDRVRLVIVGDGSELERVRRETAPFAPFATLTGLRNDIPRVLCSFDVFAMSSKTEGLPLALVEAMATKLPVVSTDVGGVGEVIGHGEAGDLVPADDEEGLRQKLEALVKDPGRAKKLAERAFARARAYDLSRTTDTYIDLYRDSLRR